MRHFGSAEEVYRADEAALSLLPDLKPGELASLIDKDLATAENILTRCYDLGISILTWQDALYPERLRNIPDPPLVLYYRGRLPSLGALPCIALVGARKASAFGLLTAKRIGYQLGRGGAAVVSGLADGIDSMAMLGALSAEAPVIGVLGCGADVVYPAKNRELYEDTISRGCILTEYPPGTPPIGYHFPVRNRIIAGLCDGVVVVEAAAKSGSLITARLALDQGRDVFAVPGNAGNEACAGSNRLLHEGALFAESGADVLEEYVSRYPALRSAGKAPEFSLTPEELRQSAAVFDTETEPKVASQVIKPKKPVDNEEKGNYIELKALMRTLPPAQCAVLEVLQGSEQSVDDIIDQCGLPTAQIMSALTMLEIRSYIRKTAANRYALAENLKSYPRRSFHGKWNFEFSHCGVAFQSEDDW